MTIMLKVRYPLGLLSFLILFSCSVSIHVRGYEVDSILMCDDIDPVSSAPIGLGEIFLTDNAYVYCWVNLTETAGSLVVRFDWRNTAGELYVSHQKTTEDLGSGLARAFDYIEIDGNPPASDPGEWTVEAYADDELIGTESFFIIDYDVIIERQDALEDQVAEVISSVSQLISLKESIQEDYEELFLDYEELFSDYNELNEAYENLDTIYSGAQEEYNSLTEDYNELILATDQLNDEYDALENDYESIAAQRSNSRNMMYVSVAFAVLSLAAAIYLYTKK
jgi:hypothetical protein